MDHLLFYLFTLCCSAALGLALFVFLKDPRSRLNRYFSAGALFLLLWLTTLYIFDRHGNAETLTLLGRVNIAAMLPVVVFAYLLVREIRHRPIPYAWLLWMETTALALLTVLTPLIDQREIIRGSEHVTLFGPLFVFNIMHVVGYLSAAIFAAVIGIRQESRQIRSQLAVLGTGLFVTAVIAITCDLILPFGFHIFAFQEIGALSTLFFLASVGYAITVNHLFNIRVVIRATLVFGLLIAFALEAYKAILDALAHLLPLGDPSERHVAAAVTVFIINAVTHEPLRKRLEWLSDRLLSERRKRQHPVKE